MSINKQEFQETVLQALELGREGKIRACNEKLRIIYSTLKTDPLMLWEDDHISHLGKSLLLMLHFDLIDDEEKSIGLALLAYLFLSKGIQNEEQMPERNLNELFRIRKDRVLLLNNFDDFFVDVLQEIYFANEKATNQEIYNEQRKAVLSRVPLIQFSDIYDIEQDFPNLKDDEFLLDAVNFIEAEKEITSEDIKEAHLLHAILFKQNLRKLKDQKLNY